MLWSSLPTAWLAFSFFSEQSLILCPNLPQLKHLTLDCLPLFSLCLELLFSSPYLFSGHFGESDLWPYWPHLQHIPLNCWLNLDANTFSWWSLSLSLDKIHSNLEFNFSLSLNGQVETRQLCRLSSTTSYSSGRLINTWIINIMSLIFPKSPILSILCLKVSRFEIQISGFLSADSNLLFAKILCKLRSEGAFFCLNFAQSLSQASL